MNFKKHLVAVLSLLIVSFSCSNDDDLIQIEPKGAYENGLFVTNEGNFGQGNGSITFISDDFSYVENNVFSSVNGVPLGDTVQSIGFHEDLAYIIVNNSQKIEVVNRYTFQLVATIDSGLDNPRFITFLSGKGYVTNWGDGFNTSDDFVAVINLETNKVASTISVGEGPEQIISHGNTIYVAHSGGYNQNNIVSVINPLSNEITTIAVGDVPNSMVLDKKGVLYVLSGGVPAWKENETAGKLSLINTSTNKVSTTLDFNEGQHPSNLTSGEALYYHMNNAVYKLAFEASSLPTTSEIKDVNFNFMTVHDNFLYGVDGDYTSNGIFKSFDLKSNTEEHSKNVGIIPSGIYINN